jgi:hypothetical protein
MPVSTTQAPATTYAPTSYKPVDFRKWASGMYADEYVGQYVVVDGYYLRTGMGSMNQGGMINFAVKSMSAAQIVKASQRDPLSMMDRSSEIIVVQAPLAMRDQIFGLRPEQRIRVYGRAINQLGSSVFTRQVTSSVLFVQASRIEPK